MKPYCIEKNIIIENEIFSLVIDPFAKAESLVYKNGGIECIKASEKVSLFSLTQDRLYNNELKLAHPNKRRTFESNRIRLEDGKLIVGFELIPYEAVVSVKIADRYIAFTLDDFIVDPAAFEGLIMNVPPVASFRLLQLAIADRGSFGEWLNVSFDENVAVNVLATSQYTMIDSKSQKDFRIMTADAVRGIKLKGTGAALIVSKTEKLLDAIEDIEEDYDLPRGVKSRRSDNINASVYWTGKATPDNIEEHIEYAKRGGFRFMLFYYSAFVKEPGSYRMCGDYILKDCFPNGLADVTAMLDKVKAAGITPGIHYLHTHIGIESEYMRPVADHRLNLQMRFTLSKPLSVTDTTVYVDQNPEGAAMADGCRVLRFGGELISYESYSSEYPYCFTGCVRGHNETNIEEHSRGTAGGVLDVSEYGAKSVYLDQNTDLQDEIADKIARIYNAGFEFAYFDGSEGTNAPYEFHVPNAQYRVYKKFNNKPLFAEGAAKSHFSWHILSGGNAFDVFPTNVFKEKIIQFPFKQAPRMANDFTRLNFGWWRYNTDTQPDIYEFGTSKAAAWDCPVTMMGRIEVFEQNARTKDNLEVIRRWEDVRKNKWLTKEQKQMLRDPDSEYILLINEDGDYELVRYEQVTSAADGDKALSAFIFERNGYRYAVCWHTTGEGELILPLSKDKLTYHNEIGSAPLEIKKITDGVILPLSHRRYIKTLLSYDELKDVLCNAKLAE